MILTVSATKDGGALLVVGLPRRSQEYLRRGQPAIVESRLLAQSNTARTTTLDKTDVVIAFADSDEDVRRMLEAESGKEFSAAVTPADRAEDLKELVDGLLEQVPSEHPAARCLSAAVASLAAAQREFRKAGAA